MGYYEDDLPGRPLTRREREILRLIALGLSTKQIARRIGSCPHTVDNQLASLMAKLGANNRTHAVVLALKRGLIGLN